MDEPIIRQWTPSMIDYKGVLRCHVAIFVNDGGDDEFTHPPTKGIDKGQVHLQKS